MIYWKLSLRANLSTNGLVHARWCVGPHLFQHTKLLLDKRLKTSEVKVEFRFNKPLQSCRIKDVNIKATDLEKFIDNL